MVWIPGQARDDYYYMSNILQLPGLIDIHVHLRDPGQTHKEDFYTGTAAALAGGVTTVFDMPNNARPIFSKYALFEKEKIAREKAVCDWGLYFGTDGKNVDEFAKVKDRVVGLKIYLSLSTGNYLVGDDELLDKIFIRWPKSNVIMAHAQGAKIAQVIELCKKHGSALHVTHVSTKEDLQKVIQAKKDRLKVTCDVSPHHLFLTVEDVETLKGFAHVKPSLATFDDQQFLWEHIKDIDCIASDHAPHTKEEKESNNPPFGIPGLETMLPLLITAMNEKRLTKEDIIRMTNTNPQKIFGLKQSVESYVEVNIDQQYEIENEKLKTKCGWSPFAERKVYGRVKRVFVRGTKVFEEGQVLVSPGFGHPVN